VHYDLGWSYFAPETENLARALPNKFFDYVQAGLGVICSPSYDMFAESKPWGFGIFPDEASQSSIIRLLDGLTVEQVSLAKAASVRAGYSLNFETEGKNLLEIFRHLGGSSER
jgi:hypothetical protein